VLERLGMRTGDHFGASFRPADTTDPPESFLTIERKILFFLGVTGGHVFHGMLLSPTDRATPPPRAVPLFSSGPLLYASFFKSLRRFGMTATPFCNFLPPSLGRLHRVRR